MSSVIAAGSRVRILRTGEEGTVVTVLDGSLTGEVEIRLPHYVVMVPLSDVEPVGEGA